MNEQEEKLLYKTSIILKKNTSNMKLNEIIAQLVIMIEQSQK